MIIPAQGTGDTTPKVATDQLVSGEHVQYVKLMDGTADSNTVIPGTLANGLLVDVSDKALRDNGKVDIAQFDSSLPAGTNVIGHVITDTGSTTVVSSITNSLPAGTNAIGHVVVDSGSIGVTQATVPWSVSASSLPLPTNAAVETGGNLATIAAKDFALESGGNLATAVTRLTSLMGLVLAQGASGTSATGPMMQALVSDAPQSYLDGYIQPISLTSEGRVRVATSPSLLEEDLWGSFDYPLGGEDFFSNLFAFN